MKKYPGWRSIDLNNGTLTEIPEIMITKTPETIGDFYRFYCQYLLDSNQTNTIQQITSLFVRHLVVAWGGPNPKGKRSSPGEQQAALEFINTLPIKQLQEAKNILEAHFRANDITKNIQSVMRSHLDDLLDLATKIGIINQDKTELLYRLKEVSKSRQYPQDIKLIENRPSWADRNILGMWDSDYVIGEPAKSENRIFQDWHQGINLWVYCPKLLIAICAVDIYQSRPNVYLANPELDGELCNFIQFLITRLNHREVTAERDFLANLRYLAWLQHQKKVPLEELRIEKIIPFVKLKLKRQDFKNERGIVDMNQFQIAKITAVEDMEEITQETINFFDEYLDSRRISPQSKINYMKSFVNLAKYVYADETQEFKAQRGFTDVPFIQKLRQRNDEFLRQSSDTPKCVIPKEKRMIPWLEVLDVVEKLRFEALLTNRFHTRSNRLNSSGKFKVDKVKRTEWARACDFQQFLMMAIYTAMPPGRPRDYYELEIEKTFVIGDFQSGIFTPQRQMKNPYQAQWWIHLLPQDYKTGKKYGEFWQRVPNTKFRDGTTLYSYIDEWLTTWRPIFKPNHSRLFTTEKGKEIDSSAFGGRIERSICRFTGVRVNPHSLRHIFVTHLRHIAASEEVLNSAAKAMRHSRKTQASIYDLQELQAALEPSLELAQHISESFFANYQRQS